MTSRSFWGILDDLDGIEGMSPFRIDLRVCCDAIPGEFTVEINADRLMGR